MKKKLQICMVTDHNCMRVTKESTALALAGGYDLHLLSPTLKNDQAFQTCHQYADRSRFEAQVKLLGKSIDIWHVHNEPSWMVAPIRTILPKAKIVFDCHDSNYWFLPDEQRLYETPEIMTWYNEDLAVGFADAIITPSPGCSTEIKTRKAYIKGTPVIDLPPAVPLMWYELRQWNTWGGLVSQGGHSTKQLRGIKRLTQWRDYGDLYTALRPHHKVFAYSPMFNLTSSDEKTKQITQYYLNMGVSVNKFTYHDLLKRLGEHTWNLVGNLHRQAVMDIMMPNKLFDAIAGGVPSIVLNAKTVGEFVEKHDIGIYIKTPKGKDDLACIDEINRRWDEALDKRKNLLMKRRLFSMERYIGRVVKLYKKLMGG